MAEDNWDLFAVVRSCSSSSATSHTQENKRTASNEPDENPLSCLADLTFVADEEDPFLFPTFAQPSSDRDSSCTELQDSYKPFLSSYSSVSVQTRSELVPKQEQKDEQERNAVSIRASLSSATTSSPVFVFQGQQEEQQQQQAQVPVRSRKRKNQQKRTICHVTQENLSSDMWAWRKYGQKPIKGSPYPRNYYRCSSSKGCLARKQVERSNLDANIFIVNYTGDHTHPRPTHRNSLAGSIRNKPQPANSNPKSATCQPPHETEETSEADRNLSPKTPLKESDDVQGSNADEEISQEIVMGDEEEEEEEVDEDDLLIPNLGVRDREDLFPSMQGLVNDFQPWSAGRSATAAAAGRGGEGGYPLLSKLKS